MAKGQQSKREAKKPKKDVALAKPVSADAIRAPITTAVLPKGKDKKKLAGK